MRQRRHISASEAKKAGDAYCTLRDVVGHHFQTTRPADLKQLFAVVHFTVLNYSGTADIHEDCVYDIENALFDHFKDELKL